MTRKGVTGIQELSTTKSSFRIFVIDDDRLIAETTSKVLEMAGFEATSFTDPRLLLSHCDVSPPGLVISDIIMPPMDGFELAQALKDKIPQCRVILFTGQAGVDDLRDLALEQGLDVEVLSKPLRPTELIAKASSFERAAVQRACA